jgi:hypothetical protein
MGAIISNPRDRQTVKHRQITLLNMAVSPLAQILIGNIIPKIFAYCNPFCQMLCNPAKIFHLEKAPVFYNFLKKRHILACRRVFYVNHSHHVESICFPPRCVIK